MRVLKITASSCPALALFLPCSALLCSALLLPCSCPALLMLLPRSCIASTPLLVLPTPVWQPSSSSSAPYDFFRHGESRLLWYYRSQMGQYHVERATSFQVYFLSLPGPSNLQDHRHFDFCKKEPSESRGLTDLAVILPFPLPF